MQPYLFLTALTLVLSYSVCGALAPSPSRPLTARTESDTRKSLEFQEKTIHHHTDDDNDKAGEACVNPKRRSVLSTSAAAVAAALLTVRVSIPGTAAQASIFDPPTIDQQVQALETANRVGQPFRKIYQPNTVGDPAKHLPLATVSENRLVTVQANHVMKPEHYIQFMWLKDVQKDQVVFVKGFPSSEPSPPTLQVVCPPGVTLRPYLFCNLHGLWKGDEFTVA